MKIEDLYSLIETIEKDKKWLFIVYPKGKKVGIDVLDWESEDCVDGDWFKSVEEAYKFVSDYKDI